jgi:cytochrome c oxidase subunit II
VIEVAGHRVPHHGVRIVVIWGVLCAIAIPLVVLVLGPHLPPGRMSAEAGAQTDANTVLTALLTPILLLILVFFGYALASFRQHGEAIEDGPPIRGHNGIQLTWLIATATIVTALAVWGSYTLVSSAHGAGGGQGPSAPIKPSGSASAVPVQVIGQQWEWTYRYPSYGGFETRDLRLPVNTLVEFHVTSLDVTHSFWAYRLGVKADAVPGVDNIAYVTARDTGSFTVRCAELCGLWHGHMYGTGHVVPAAAFRSWAAHQQAVTEPFSKYLAPYSRTYFPLPLHRAG